MLNSGKRTTLFGLALAAACATTSLQAATISVSQGGQVLGTIESYNGTLSSAANYNYYSSANHLYTGPDTTSNGGTFFFYEGSDGLTFNMIYGNGGNSTIISDVEGTLAVDGSTEDPYAVLSDDPNEFRETSDNVFTLDYRFYQYLGDGGVVGGLAGNNWEITLDLSYITNLSSLVAYGTFNELNLDLDPSKDIVFSTISSVPLPPAMWLLLSGLMGFAALQKRKK